MAKIVWMTDIHLEMVDDDQFQQLMDEVQNANPTCLLLGGDIAVSGSISRWLLRIASSQELPVYFVLGNHDYYYGSIGNVRQQVQELCEFSNRLFWLPQAGPVQLTERTALIGHGGWGDGRYGDFMASTVRLNDYLLIQELSGIPQQERLSRLNGLGDEAAESLRKQLQNALEHNEHVYALMHVPPYQRAALHEGQPSDDNFAPHFSCKAVGDMFLEEMAAQPNKQLTVLCGHTHGGGETQIADNITVHTGPATYREPAVAKVIELA
jgi:Icc-related predicted phosphoesterase